MRRAVLMAAAFAAACSSSTSDSVASGTWGTAQASVTTTATSATLRLLQSGLGCYGSYADVAQPIPAGSFSLPATYTQLTGFFPGRVEYSAEFSGSVAGDQMTVTVSVPALQQSFGPYALKLGVSNSWTACMFP